MVSCAHPALTSCCPDLHSCTLSSSLHLRIPPAPLSPGNALSTCARPLALFTSLVPHLHTAQPLSRPTTPLTHTSTERARASVTHTCSHQAERVWCDDGARDAVHDDQGPCQDQGVLRGKGERAAHVAHTSRIHNNTHIHTHPRIYSDTLLADAPHVCVCERTHTHTHVHSSALSAPAPCVVAPCIAFTTHHRVAFHDDANNNHRARVGLNRWRR
jgi:hypothetical protein